ncbi:MAG: HAD family phosphatase [Demequina sp.]
MSRPAAVLWDMDGTLVDSEPYWIAAETELAHSFDVPWTHADGLSLVGNPLTVSGAVLRDRGVDLPLETIVDRLLKRVTEQVQESIPWQSDARALLDEVVKAGIPCALVTMSYRALADAMLAHVPGVFDVVVTGDSVTHGKPHPEPFLTAAQSLGVDIHDCIAIEDSPSGTASAHASGAVTIAVKREAQVPPRQGMSRLHTLEGVGVSGLRAFMEGRVVDDLATEG